MESPRIKPVGWAPPPPIMEEPPRIEPKPLPQAEDDFDVTLGNLVDHYAQMPPPTYGEPPITKGRLGLSPVVTQEVYASLPAPKPWVWVLCGAAALFVGAVATFLAMAVPWNKLSGEAIHENQAIQTPQQNPEIKIRVAPETEPLEVKSEGPIAKDLDENNPTKAEAKGIHEAGKDGAIRARPARKRTNKKRVRRSSRRKWKNKKGKNNPAVISSEAGRETSPVTPAKEIASKDPRAPEGSGKIVTSAKPANVPPTQKTNPKPKKDKWNNPYD